MKTQINAKTWKDWRRKLGASKKDARELYREYQELLKELPPETRVRVLDMKRGEPFEKAFARFIDSMPRKPYAFLARVAAIEARRARQAEIDEQKAVNRRRYERRYQRVKEGHL